MINNSIIGQFFNPKTWDYVIASSAAAAGQTFLMSENFDEVGANGWAGAGTINYDSTDWYVSPSQSCQLTRVSSSTYTIKNTTGSASEWWLFSAIKWTGGAVPDSFIEVKNSGGTTFAILNIRATGELRAYSDISGSVNSGNTAATMSAGNTYFVWWHQNSNNGTFDCEFQTTPTKIGSGSNYKSGTGGDTNNVISQVKLCTLNDNTTMSFDNVLVSNTSIGSVTIPVNYLVNETFEGVGYSDPTFNIVLVI